MKPQLMMLAAIMAIAICSCQREPRPVPPTPDPDDSNLVTFQVSIPNPLKTTRFSDGGGVAELTSGYTMRIVMQAIAGDTISATITQPSSISANNINFNVTLAAGTYDLLFWADFMPIAYPDSAYYDVTSLRAVFKKQNTSVAPNASSYTPGYCADAYYGALTSQTVASGYQMPPLTLSRPFGRLEITASNFAFPAATSVQIIYMAPIPMGFNVATGDITKDIMTPAIQQVFVPTAATQQDLILDYIFAAANGSTKVSCKVNLDNSAGQNIIASQSLSNIPITRNQRSRVLTPLVSGINGQTYTINISNNAYPNINGQYSVTTNINWTNIPNASSITIVPAQYGYAATTTYALQAADISGQSASITSSNVLPQTSYIVNFLDVNSNVIATARYTTPYFDNSDIIVIQVKPGQWRPDLSLIINKPGTYFIMPGEYQISDHPIIVGNGDLNIIGNDPNQVEIYYATSPVGVYGTVQNFTFRNLHITANSANVIEMPTNQAYDVTNVLFDNCAINLSQYGGGGNFGSLLSAQSTAAGQDANITNYTVNNCSIYDQGLSNYHCILQGAANGNSTLQVNNIIVTNTTIVDTGNGFIQVRSAAGVDFPYTILFNQVTTYNIMNNAYMGTPGSLFEMTATGSEAKSFFLGGIILNMGALVTGPNPSYARFLSFPNVTGGYPNITALGPIIFYNTMASNNNDFYYGDGTNNNIASPQFDVKSSNIWGSFVGYSKTPSQMWKNPTNSYTTFNFAFLDPDLIQINSTIPVGDQWWNNF